MLAVHCHSVMAFAPLLDTAVSALRALMFVQGVGRCGLVLAFLESSECTSTMAWSSISASPGAALLRCTRSCAPSLFDAFSQPMCVYPLLRSGVLRTDSHRQSLPPSTINSGHTSLFVYLLAVHILSLPLPNSVYRRPSDSRCHQHQPS